MTIPAKALKHLEDHEKIQNKVASTSTIATTISDDQRISRGLYIFADQHQSQSDASQIYANVGLACIGIRRLLQVC